MDKYLELINELTTMKTSNKNELVTVNDEISHKNAQKDKYKEERRDIYAEIDSIEEKLNIIKNYDKLISPMVKNKRNFIFRGCLTSIAGCTVFAILSIAYTSSLLIPIIIFAIACCIIFGFTVFEAKVNFKKAIEYYFLVKETYQQSDLENKLTKAETQKLTNEKQFKKLDNEISELEVRKEAIIEKLNILAEYIERITAKRNKVIEDIIQDREIELKLNATFEEKPAKILSRLKRN